MIRGIRGATTVDEDSEKLILEETEILLIEIIKENKLEAEQVASVLFSVTEDLTACFPAKAMRAIDGWKYVPVMCTREIPVPESLSLCVRVMMHVNTDRSQQEINHVYLRNAISLRPDLAETEKE
ncbi:MAG: chorismate mutase [Cytobacillus gottheilii]|uniref:chorismate mutase n=1 Tax=Cytobacillus gottheilii TaxID=859144 RepID=UPI00346393E7